MSGEHLRPQLFANLSIGGLDACWEWQGRLHNEGYGVLWDRENQREVFVHRLVYERLRGSIPLGLQIDHLCRNPSCANPQHLDIVTRRENILRGESEPAKNARKTHCIRGHELTPENTYIRRNGHRQCLLCKRRLLREHKTRRRAALQEGSAE